ncbi:MAG: hypothetical protein HY721_04835 [Planctomycetes bacterium]|nr:hypothetical protein [Planctomycetota bacterium]
MTSVSVLVAFASVLAQEQAPAESAAESPADSAPITIAEVRRPEPVDFHKEILPYLRVKCIACHSKTEHKADLVLETPEAILEGGKSGPAAVPGKGAESLIVKVASRVEKPFMPPRNNKVGAHALTSEELGLLRLWIDQGAKCGSGAAAAAIRWHPLPPGVNPIYAVAVTTNGRLAAASRANQVFLYNLAAGTLSTRLTDPALLQSGLYVEPGVADVDGVQSLAFAPGGDVLASGGFRTVKVWRREASPKRLALPGIGAPLTALAASGDGARLAGGTADGRVVVWTVADGKAARPLAAHAGAVTGLELSADGAILVSGSLDGSVAAWSAADGFPLGRLAAGGPVHSLALAANGQVAAGCADGAVRAWPLPKDGASPAPPAPAAVLTGHAKPVTCLEAVPGQAPLVVSGSEDGTVRWWDLAAAKEVKQVSHGGPVLAVAARPDAKAFASAGADKAARLWNAESNQQIAELKGDPAARHAADLRSRESAYLAGIAGGAKNALAEAEKRAGEAGKKASDLKSALEKLVADQAAAAAKPEAAAKSPADKEKAAKEAEAAKVKADDDLKAAEEASKDAQGGVARAKAAFEGAEGASKAAQAAFEAAQKASAEREHAARAVAFSADGLLAAVAGEGPALHVYNAKTGALVETFGGSASPVAALVHVPGAGFASASADGSAVLWKAQADWTLERTIGSPDGIEAFADRVTALDFSPAAELLATGSGEPSRSGQLKLWKVEDGSLVREVPNAHSDVVFSVEISPDGKLLASAGADKFVRVFEVATGKLVHSFEGHTHHVLGVSWRSDGKVVASAGADSVVKVWSLETGEQIRTIGGFGKQVTAVEFVKFTPLAVASSGDASVRLHDTNNGNQARAFGGAADYVYSVAATPDGRLVAAGGFSSTLHVWDGTSGQAAATFPAPEGK